METTYQTIAGNATAIFSDRGSKFIAYAFPVSEVAVFKTNLAALKKEHPKAAHHCFAYRIGTGGDNFRVSDDGEPSGSAGRPILGHLDSRKLTDIMVVVVRYFGGTLLGVPGLINAYKTSTALALDEAAVITKPILKNFRLSFDYTLMNDVMRLVRQFTCVVQSQETLLFCRMNIGIPVDKTEPALERFSSLRGLEVEVL